MCRCYELSNLLSGWFSVDVGRRMNPALVGTLLLADEAVERAAAPEPVKQGLERRGWR